MKKLFIIIVTFNPGETFTNLVKNLRRHRKRLKEIDMEIVIVDNNSTNERLDKLKTQNFHHCQDFGGQTWSKSRSIKIIRNSENLGFAAGCNKGVKYALENRADYILFLNQDIEVESEFISSLVRNSAGIVAPVIKFRRNRKWIFDFGGKINWWLGRTKHVERLSIINHRPSIIDYVSGCCMMVKRKVFEKIGLFDESFFLYFEDVDLCLRGKKAGFKIAIESSVFVVHHLLEKGDKPISQQAQLIKSNFVFINKYLGWNRLVGYLYLFFLSLKILFRNNLAK